MTSLCTGVQWLHSGWDLSRCAAVFSGYLAPIRNSFAEGLTATCRVQNLMALSKYVQMRYSVVLALTYIASSSMIIIFPRIPSYCPWNCNSGDASPYSYTPRWQAWTTAREYQWCPSYLLVKSWLRICTPDQCECGSIDPKPQVLKHDRHEGLW